MAPSEPLTPGSSQPLQRLDEQGLSVRIRPSELRLKGKELGLSGKALQNYVDGKLPDRRVKKGGGSSIKDVLARRIIIVHDDRGMSIEELRGEGKAKGLRGKALNNYVQENIRERNMRIEGSGDAYYFKIAWNLKLPERRSLFNILKQHFSVSLAEESLARCVLLSGGQNIVAAARMIHPGIRFPVELRVPQPSDARTSMRVHLDTEEGHKVYNVIKRHLGENEAEAALAAIASRKDILWASLRLYPSGLIHEDLRNMYDHRERESTDDIYGHSRRLSGSFENSRRG